MMFILLNLVNCLNRIKLKIVDDDKFLGVVDNKLQPVDYNDALSIKLNTLKDISMKNLESRDGKALTETGFWFFPKNFSMKSNKKTSKQGFRIVYYAPEEYLLMKGDSCLGFKDNKLKKVDCSLDKAARFRICENRLCDNYMEILKGMNCIMSMLNNGKYNDDRYGNKYNDDRYGNKNSGYGNKYNPKFDPWNGYNNDDSSDSDDIYDCKEYISDYYKNKNNYKNRNKNGLDGSHLIKNYMC